MADWNNPVLATAYVNFLAHLKARDLDAATMFVSAPTNPSESMMRYVRASNQFEEYVSGFWVGKILGLLGGGTGANNASGARSNLGLGTIATQNANNVTITGGSINGVALSVSDFNAGNLDVARMPLGGLWPLTSLLEFANHSVHVEGFGAAYRTGAGTTLTDIDFLYDCSGGTVILPDCTTISHRIYIIRRATGASTVTLDPTGAQTISINGLNQSTYAGLGINQSLILQSNGTQWIAITMGGTVYRDVQTVNVVIGVGNATENQVMPATVNNVKKALIIPISAMIQSANNGDININVIAFFADSGGSEVTSGSATHLKLSSDFNAQQAQAFRLQIQEWE